MWNGWWKGRKLGKGRRKGRGRTEHEEMGGLRLPGFGEVGVSVEAGFRTAPQIRMRCLRRPLGKEPRSQNPEG